MSDTASNIFTGFMAGFILASVVGFISNGCDVNQRRTQWEADAVKHGAATWTVDENGNRVFEWKEQEQGEK